MLPGRAQVREALERGGVEARGRGERVGARLVREVEAERDRADARLADRAAGVGRQQPADVHRERHLEPAPRPFRGERERVGARERLAAGEDQHRAGQRAREVVDQRQPLVLGQLRRVRDVLGGRAAMAAGERAGARRLPGDHERRARHASIQPPRRGDAPDQD